LLLVGIWQRGWGSKKKNSTSKDARRALALIGKARSQEEKNKLQDEDERRRDRDAG